MVVKLCVCAVQCYGPIALKFSDRTTVMRCCASRNYVPTANPAMTRSPSIVQSYEDFKFAIYIYKLDY